jgi:hypothetical protein
MATDSDEPDDAAERLEAALERIARAARPVETGRVEAGAGQGAGVPEQVAPRLDALIARLRTALGEPD